MKGLIRASQVAQRLKNLPAMQEVQETWVQFLGPEDPLKEGMATHSSIIAWRVLWTEEPACSPRDLKELDATMHAQSYLGFPGDSDYEESPCNAGDPASIPG